MTGRSTAGEVGRRSRAVRWVLLLTAGVLLALAVRYGPVPRESGDIDAIQALIGIASVHLQQSVPGAELIDIEVLSNSVAEVAYSHDELFDVVFVYRRDGQKRTITAPYGLNGTSWITPTKVEMQSRDESALVVQ